MTTNYSLDRPPSQPKPHRVSKLNDIQVISSEGINLVEIQYQLKPIRNRQKKPTTIGLQIANYDLAIQRANTHSNRYYKSQQISTTIPQQHFKIYGPGIYLFFSFIWNLSLLFLILTLISLLPMIYNYLQGTKFSQSVNSMSVFIARLSIGNFYGDDPQLTSDQQISSTRVPKLINCISDLVSMLIIMLFYFYWSWKSDRITEQIKQNFNLPNYHTLQLTKFPQSTTDIDVYNFFTQFGTVNQIAPVKNYSQTIKLSKEIFQCQMEIKSIIIDSSNEFQLLDNNNQKNIYSLNSQNQNHSAVVEISPKNNEKLLKLKENLHKLYKQLYEQQKKSKQQTIKYYITFSTPQQRAFTLTQFNKVYSACCLCLASIPQKFMLKDQKVQVKACHNQPGQIIWQNVHITWKTRWMRALLQMLVLLVIICLGYFVISSLDEISPPTTYDSIDTSSYTTTSILLQSNTTITQSWCLKNTAIATSTSTSLTSLCQPYINLYYLNLAITYAITIFVIVVKILIKKLVIWIAKFQRYTSHTAESIDVMKNLVIIYVITTVVIGFLLQADLFGIQFKNIVPNLLNNSTMKQNAALMTDYSVLSNSWYIDIGYQIWLTWLILSLSPHTLMPIYHYLMQWLNHKLAKTQKLQSAMDNMLLPAQFQIQDHYANIIMIFFVAIVFSGGIPSMIIVSFVGIITRYLYLKFLFIRFSKVPKSIDEHLNIAVLSYFPWAIGGHFLMTIWMYNVNSVFAFQQSIFSSWYNQTSSSFVQFISKALQMMVGSYYYTIVAILIMLFILIKQLIYDIFIRICRNPHTQIQQQSMSSAVNELVTKKNNPMLISHRGITNSYMIQNNPNYFEILSIKNKMKTKIQNGEFQSQTQKN